MTSTHAPAHTHEHSHTHEPVPQSRRVTILYVDPVAGASGDMFLGALVDLGVDFEELREGLRALRVPGFDLRQHATKRHTIAATKVDVVVEDVEHPHRHVGDLLAIVEAADLPGRVKERSRRVLTLLAEAESRAHRMSVEKVHLHEVGGLDCLVDVVGTCLGLELLGMDRLYSGPAALGTGHVSCAHGRMPVPAPGTLAILHGFPVRKTTFEGEMTTPTGAALLAGLCTGVLSPLTMIPRRVGYGAGTKDKPALANMLRLVLADTETRLLPAGSAGTASHTHSHHH